MLGLPPLDCSSDTQVALARIVILLCTLLKRHSYFGRHIFIFFRSMICTHICGQYVIYSTIYSICMQAVVLMKMLDSAQHHQCLVYRPQPQRLYHQHPIFSGITKGSDTWGHKHSPHVASLSLRWLLFSSKVHHEGVGWHPLKAGHPEQCAPCSPWACHCQYSHAAPHISWLSSPVAVLLLTWPLHVTGSSSAWAILSCHPLLYKPFVHPWPSWYPCTCPNRVPRELTPICKHFLTVVGCVQIGNRDWEKANIPNRHSVILCLNWDFSPPSPKLSR